MATGYIYQALSPDRKEIRLLQIQAQDRKDPKPLQCRMKHVSLLNLEKIRFSAVSYFWGDVTKRKDVMIDGIAVSVPENVELALRYLHSQHHWKSHKMFTPSFKKGSWKYLNKVLRFDKPNMGQKYLWIDAICINQQDLDERGQQVSIMDLVYLKALMTVVWLGEDTDGLSQSAVISIVKLYEQYLHETDNEKNVRGVLADARPGPTDPSLLGSVIMLPKFTFGDLPEGLDWDALEAYFRSTWFYRTWVLQEVLLAECSICVRGDWCCPCYVATAAANWLHYRRPLESMNIETIDTGPVEPFFRPRIMYWQFRNFQFGHEPHQGDVYQLLTDITNFDTTEPSDKVYSILSLLPDLNSIMK